MISYYSSTALLIAALMLPIKQVLKITIIYYLIISGLMPAYWFLTTNIDGSIIESIQFMTLNNLLIFLAMMITLPLLSNKNSRVNFYCDYSMGRKDIFLAAIVVFLGFVLIGAGKPHLLTALLSEQSLLVVRTTSQPLDFPYSLINSFINEWEYIAVAALLVGYGSEGRKNKIIRIILMILLVYMSMSTLRKGAIFNIALIFLIYFVFKYGLARVGKKVIDVIFHPFGKVSNILILIIIFVFAGIIFILFINYGYEVGEVIPGLFSRIFLEEFANIPIYISFYQPFECCDFRYLPSQGSGLWGVEQINLEQQLFSDLYPHRGDRYGNLPVLGIISGSKAFGVLIGVIVTFLLYVFSILIIYFFERQARSRSDLLFLKICLSMIFISIFAGGAYRIFSPYTLLSVSTLFSFVFMIFYILRVKVGGKVSNINRK
jgi:hypothetical protein